MTLEDITRRIRKDCDDYCDTVLALKAFAHEMLWDGSDIIDGPAFFGRSMTTSSANRISPDNTVTPDLIVQPQPQYGVVAEAKIALSSDPKKRVRKLLALQKYDDDLTGWKTDDEKIKRHDVVLLCHNFHGTEVCDQLRDLQQTSAITFDRKFAVVSFIRGQQTETWMSLALEMGDLSDTAKKDKLRKRLQIRLDHIAGNPRFASVEIYDHPPPLPMLMHFIEQVVVNDLDQNELLRHRQHQPVLKSYSVDDMRDRLATSFALPQDKSRTPKVPRRASVKEAMEAFVALGWAQRAAEPKGYYLYTVKKRHGNLFERFLTFVAKQLWEAEQAKEEAAKKEKDPNARVQKRLFNA
jgi:hypothetical protein